VFKKIILAVATFGIICVAYVIYQWQDVTTTRSPRVAEPPVRPVARRAVATQPAASRPEDATFSFKGARIPPGESPRVSVFDDKGNARYVFQCTGWKPLSDNEFHITNPTARLLLPGGQLAYVWADEGQVVFQRGDGNALNPKSGWLRGHVRIFIDRSMTK
jgi:DNA-binding beta-propeller fold protein YncE